MKSKLNYFKIENFRSLIMEENFNSLPITILIGRNSAGKSTFARSFPLMRQSIEATKRAPILWFGDRVDFGSFEESLCKLKLAPENTNNEITFTFGLSLTYNRYSGLLRLPSFDAEKLEISIRISIAKPTSAPSQATKIQINGFGYNILIKLGSQSTLEELTIDDFTWKANENFVSLANYGALLPTFSIYKLEVPQIPPNAPKQYSSYNLCFDEINTAVDAMNLEGLDNFISMTLKHAPLLEKNELKNHVSQGISNYGWGDLSAYKKRKVLKVLDEIEPMVFASKINTLIDFLNDGLKEYYEGVKYIEPLRAPAIRYYRKQELAIDEIDSKGENLAMFIDNLSPSQLRKFNEWTKKSFGFSARTKKSFGHVEIVINENQSETGSNLTDIGFGFSQILPVITQIWLSSQSQTGKQKKASCVVIEQPELHLHPAFQSKLANIFAGSVNEDSDSSPSFIIETHSNHIINRFGQLISEGMLDSRKIQILIFEKDLDGVTQIKKAGFDSDGYLQNWPLGFFEPEV